MIRILVVDDEGLVRRATCRFLESADLISVVAQADNGPGALAEIAREQPHIVLLDLHMPGMSGLEVLAAVMQMPDRRPSVIMLTADFDERYARDAILLGAMGYLLKYSCGDTLIPAIHSVFGGRRYVSPEFKASLGLSEETHPGAAPASVCAWRTTE